MRKNRLIFWGDEKLILNIRHRRNSKIYANKAISKFILHKLRNWSYVEIAQINLTVYSLMT